MSVNSQLSLRMVPVVLGMPLAGTRNEYLLKRGSKSFNGSTKRETCIAKMPKRLFYLREISLLCAQQKVLDHLIQLPKNGSDKSSVVFC